MLSGASAEQQRHPDLGVCSCVPTLLKGGGDLVEARAAGGLDENCVTLLHVLPQPRDGRVVVLDERARAASVAAPSWMPRAPGPTTRSWSTRSAAYAPSSRCALAVRPELEHHAEYGDPPRTPATSSASIAARIDSGLAL